MEIPLSTLHDGNKLAFGTGIAWFKSDGSVDFDPGLVEISKSAILKCFYHLDCAEMYGTEEEVGIAIKESGVPRDKLFITSKVEQGIDDITAALDRSLHKMQMKYFDLYLIHIPFFAKSDADFQRAWKVMEEMKKAGKVKSIGVSNYLRPHLEATLKGATDPPVINQIEYHPNMQRANNYIPWMREHGIQVGSFTGLTPAFRAPNGPLRAPFAEIAKAHGNNEAVMLLAWLIQSNVVAVTTTGKPERLDEYAHALNTKLTEEELHQISEIGSTYHFRTSWRAHFKDDDRS